MSKVLDGCDAAQRRLTWHFCTARSDAPRTSPTANYPFKATTHWVAAGLIHGSSAALALHARSTVLLIRKQLAMHRTDKYARRGRRYPVPTCIFSTAKRGLTPMPAPANSNKQKTTPNTPTNGAEHLKRNAHPTAVVSQPILFLQAPLFKPHRWYFDYTMCSACICGDDQSSTASCEPCAVSRASQPRCRTIQQLSSQKSLNQALVPMLTPAKASQAEIQCSTARAHARDAAI